MKFYIIILLTLLNSVFNTSYAQTSENIAKTEQAIKKNGKYALLVMSVQHLKSAIKTGIELKTYSPKIDIQIISCGELVRDISKDKDLQNLTLNAITKNGLKILICGLSIEQLKIDKTLLPIEIPVTKNGLIYLFGLQELGYKSITL